MDTQIAKTGQRPDAQEQYFAAPPADVFENDDGITLLADLPGVGKEGLVVRVDAEHLLIEGTAEVASPPNMQMLYSEIHSAGYRRQFRLSRELDSSRIDAQLKDGVLRLSIPKAEAAKPRRIEVRVG